MGLWCYICLTTVQLFLLISKKKKKNKVKAPISSNCLAFNLSECFAHIQVARPGVWGGSKYLWPGNMRLSFYTTSICPSAFFPRIDNQQIPTDPVTLVSQQRGEVNTVNATKTAKHEMARDMAWQNKQKTTLKIQKRDVQDDRIQYRMRQAWDRHVQSWTRLSLQDALEFVCKQARSSPVLT